MEYTVDCVFTFVKTANLTDWFNHSAESKGLSPEVHKIAFERYSQERPVQLTAQMCYSVPRKTFCCIKCPINPLPTTGWFETPSVSVLRKALEAHGWTLILTQSKDLIT